MKLPTFLLASASIFAVVLTGCGHKDHLGETDSASGHGHNAAGGHSDSAQTFSGATHKEGTGITLLDETKQLLGIQTVEVQEQSLPRKVHFTARVFETDAATAAQLASGMVSTNDATLLHAGLPVQFQPASGQTATGVVHQVIPALARGEAEVIVTLAESERGSRGYFGEITISIPGDKNILVVPREAVIKGTTGDLVYAVNGDAYTLIWVQTGAEANGLVEITDGLLAGDSVVMRGAMDLWLVELRAVKGGQGCCPAPVKKGKG